MNYESTNQCFPLQSMIAATAAQDTSATGYSISWIPPILQFTEQTAMYNAYNFSLDPMAAAATAVELANTTVACSRLALLTCPSDNMQPQPLRQLLTTGIYFGTTNYVGNYGGPGPSNPISGTIIPSNNHWMNNVTSVPLTFGPVSIASITDGTSNTGLISERLIGLTNSGIYRTDTEYLRGEWHVNAGGFAVRPIRPVRRRSSRTFNRATPCPEPPKTVTAAKRARCGRQPSPCS